VLRCGVWCGVVWRCGVVWSDASAAIHYHALHRAAADVSGQYIACTNLGLLYTSLIGYAQPYADANPPPPPPDPAPPARARRSSSSAAAPPPAPPVLTAEQCLAHDTHFASLAVAECQRALQCAVELKSRSAQCTALANLAVAAEAGGDVGSAEACWRRHLALCAELGLSGAQRVARQALGELALTAGDANAAEHHFQQVTSCAAAVHAGDAHRLSVLSLNMLFFCVVL
jgi:hypothetical protein